LYAIFHFLTGGFWQHHHRSIESAMDQNNKRIVMALQSGLKSELTWALNTLTVLSFKEKEDHRKDATPLALAVVSMASTVALQSIQSEMVTTTLLL
jgi:hypothetical protein